MINSLLIYSLPIFLTALGGFFTDQSGLLNIAAEGLILCGAFVSFTVLSLTGSIPAALVIAALAAALVSSLYAALTLRLRGNIFITGLAMNLLIPGIITMVSKGAYGTGGVLQVRQALVSSEAVSAGFLILSALVFIVSVRFLKGTKAGLSVRAAGLNQRALEIRGGNPVRIQVLTFGYSGLLSGLAGAMLTLTVHAYVPNISSGKGWLALAAIYLGNRKASGLIYATVFFALAEMLATLAQGAFDLPSSLFSGFPYLITFIGLTIRGAIVSKKRA